MAHYVCGCDPDSKAHGVAIYKDGKLAQMGKMTLMEIIVFIKKMQLDPGTESLLFSIENVMANQFMYSRNMFPKITDLDSKMRMACKMARNVGYCQQAYTELIRVLDFFSIKYVTYKPSKSNWCKAKDKATFERMTGWTGRSNEDCRSAAYFAFLALDVNTDKVPF